jgi:hypothetical protein
VDPVSQKILQLHQDAPNFMGIPGGVEVGGFVIHGDAIFYNLYILYVLFAIRGTWAIKQRKFVT